MIHPDAVNNSLANTGYTAVQNHQSHGAQEKPPLAGGFTDDSFPRNAYTGADEDQPANTEDEPSPELRRSLVRCCFHPITIEETAVKDSIETTSFSEYFCKVMTVTKDRYITIEYTFSAPDGTLLGSSEYSGPFTFRQGYGDVVPGLDTRMEGAHVGEERTFIVPPAEGYGERDESLVRRIAPDSLPLGREPEPGLRVNVNGTVMMITEVTAEAVTLDSNHPLAGIPLHFNVRVASISDEAPASHGDCGCGGSCSCGS